MPPKRNAGSSANTPSATPSKPSTSSTTSTTSSSSLSSKSSPQDIAVHVWNQYLRTTPSRIKLLDTFMAWLVVVGGVQFVYCVIGGNYPFNAFLSSFTAAVGQFVLTASLRMQITTSSSSSPSISSTSSNLSPPTAKDSVKGSEKASGDVIEDLGQGGKGYSHERAFADYVFGSLVLHLFCVNFIN